MPVGYSVVVHVFDRSLLAQTYPRILSHETTICQKTSTEFLNKPITLNCVDEGSKEPPWLTARAAPAKGLARDSKTRDRKQATRVCSEHHQLPPGFTWTLSCSTFLTHLVPQPCPGSPGMRNLACGSVKRRRVSVTGRGGSSVRLQFLDLNCVSRQ